MYEQSDLFFEKMKVDDFNNRVEEIFNTTRSMQEYDSIVSESQNSLSSGVCSAQYYTAYMRRYTQEHL
jgi:hypothetical protein